MNVADLAAQTLDFVRAELKAEAEVFVRHDISGLTRFANSFIHQNVATDVTSVSLRLHVNGRTASGATTRTDPDGLRALVSNTAAAATLLSPDNLWAGLTPPTGLPAESSVDAGLPVDEATAAATPAERAARVASFVEATTGLAAAGYCSTDHVVTAFANTAGHAGSGAYTLAEFDGVGRAVEGGADGVARQASTRLADIDGAVLGARAGAKARAGVDPVYLAPGVFEVVLEPEAVGDLLGNFGVHGFNGKAFAERRSFVELGAAQFDPMLSIVDDPLAPGVPSLPYDREGTPKRRLELVRAGVTCAVTHDRRTAKEVGAESTGHGEAGSEAWGPIASHLTFSRADGSDPADGGDPTQAPTEVDGPAADSDVASLVAGVRRGLLVTDLWYTRVLDPRPLTVTGLTRNGVWLIENGEVTRAVRNLRFTQQYPAALGPGRVLAIGRHARTLPAGWGFSANRARALRLAEWNFTGGAEG
jgi:predicted Zn-dependent protease